MRWKMLAVLALAIGLIVVAGCINYDQELTLNADGGGTIKVHYTSDAQKETEGEGSLSMGDVPKLAFTEEDIKAEYEGAPVTVRDIEIGKTDTQAPEATYVIDFKNVTDLNGHGIFALEGDKLKQTFSLEPAGDNTVFKQLVQFKMDVEDPSTLSSYKFTYKFTPPGEIVETDGTVGEGNTVSWEYGLDKLINKDTVMNVTYKTAGGGAKNIGLIIGIILCVVILVVIIIVIVVLLARKKKKAGGPAAPAAPTTPSEPSGPTTA